MFLTVCTIDYDPFLLMQDGDKKYGFTVTIYEYASTIATLWDTTKGTLFLLLPLLK